MDVGVYADQLFAQHGALRSAESEAASRHAATLLKMAHRRAEQCVCGEHAGAVERVAVVGAGLMGTQIAAAHAEARLPTRVLDPCPAARQSVRERAATFLRNHQGDNEPAAQTRVAEWIEAESDPAQLAGCDLVIESVPESLPLKRQVLAQAEAVVGPAPLLATNTSTIDITELAAGLRHRERFCGIHFLHPVRERILVEIVPGEHTAGRTIARAMAYVLSLGKLPLVVRNAPAFLVNRLLWPYLSEAMEMLRQGVAAEQLEEAATGFGMAMGPLRIADEIGLDTLIRAGQILWRAFPQRAAPSPLPVVMVKQGRLGRKSAAGFYRYDSKQPWQGNPRLDPEMEQLMAHWIRRPNRLPAEQIVLRLLLAVVSEAARLLEESSHYTPHDIDLAMVFGLGFPSWRGGLLYWADRLGSAAILRLLQSWEHTAPWASPPRLLRDLAAANCTFYDYDWSKRRWAAA